ncbi:MAG: hypothetical protein EOM66_07700 [Clostridia bacterium]|nr:hypothetical protein [Candidatus Pelethousia sp.]NCB31275.1 hypothetical protein [Clostridia bacterium]
MKRTLQGSKGTKTPLPNMDEINRMSQNVDPNQLNEVQNIVEHYSGKSETELMKELRSARQKGVINPNDLANVAQRLAPMLTPEQQQRLIQVMDQLK